MGVENRRPAKRLLALMAAICTLGSLAVTPMANAEDTTPTQAADDCVAVDTAKNADKFKWGDDQKTVVKGFTSEFLAEGHSCYDLNISANVTEIYGLPVEDLGAFHDQPIHKLTFDDGDVPLTIGSYAFSGAKGLKELSFPSRLQNLSGFNTFANTGSLETVIFPAGSTVTEIGNDIFYGGALKSVKLPPKLTKIGNAAFMGDSKNPTAYTIEWPAESTSLTIDDQAFDYSKNTTLDFTGTKLTSLDIGDLAFAGGEFTSVKFPSKMDRLILAGGIWDWGRNQVTAFTLPDEVDDLQFQGGRYTFDGVEAAAAVRLPKKVGKAYIWTPAGGGLHPLTAPDGVDADSDYWDAFIFANANPEIVDSKGNEIDLPLWPHVRVYVQDSDKSERHLQTVEDKTQELTAPQAPASKPSDVSEGLEFAGWKLYRNYPDENDYTRYELLQPGAVQTVGAGEFTWVAQWKAAWTVSYDLSGLPEGVKLPDDAAKYYAIGQRGGRFVLPTPAPEVKGLTFTGWTWTSDYDLSQYPQYAGAYDQTTPITSWDQRPANAVNQTDVAGNLTVTPHYSGTVKSVEQPAGVTYWQGGEPVLPKSVKVTYEGGAVRNLTAGWDATENGQAIDWKTLKAGTVKTLKATLPDDAGDVRVTVTVLAKAQVTYDANGGTGTMNPTEGAAGAKVKVAVNGFARSGYRFTGWNTLKDGKGTAYKAGQEVELPADGLTLYAQWQATGGSSSGGNGGTTPTPKPDPEPVSCSFSDVSASTPHRDDICWLAAEGIATGYADGT
ncbi:leucine-rich repeat protein, partial [Bifidobacterium miconisargentati]|uniref:leucine-rich repeat protein n=1 Tax=Bifidobacterium miconisargentati TaxID=2834437 RepID=UPI001BDC487D